MEPLPSSALSLTIGSTSSSRIKTSKNSGHFMKKISQQDSTLTLLRDWWTLSSAPKAIAGPLSSLSRTTSGWEETTSWPTIYSNTWRQRPTSSSKKTKTSKRWLLFARSSSWRKVFISLFSYGRGMLWQVVQIWRGRRSWFETWGGLC